MALDVYPSQSGLGDLLAVDEALDRQDLKSDEQHRSHAPDHVGDGLPDRDLDRRLAIRIQPAVGGRESDSDR